MSSIISGLAGDTKIQIMFNDAFSTSDNAPANSHDIGYNEKTGIFTETVTLSTDKLAETSKEYITTKSSMRLYTITSHLMLKQH